MLTGDSELVVDLVVSLDISRDEHFTDRGTPKIRRIRPISKHAITDSDILDRFLATVFHLNWRAFCEAPTTTQTFAVRLADTKQMLAKVTTGWPVAVELLLAVVAAKPNDCGVRVLMIRAGIKTEYVVTLGNRTCRTYGKEKEEC